MPRLAQRRVILFFCPMRASSENQTFSAAGSTPFSRAISSRRAGKFFYIPRRFPRLAHGDAGERRACDSPWPEVLGPGVDFDARLTRAAAKRSKNAPQARRLLALAAIYDGAARSEAAKIGGVTLQIVRDWVVKFNAHGPEGLIDRKPPGQPSRLDDTHRAALAAIIESGPIPAIHGVVRWRIVDLCQWIFEEFRVTIAKQTLGRELRAMGYRKLSARPCHHAQAGNRRGI